MVTNAGIIKMRAMVILLAVVIGFYCSGASERRQFLFQHLSLGNRRPLQSDLCFQRRSRDFLSRVVLSFPEFLDHFPIERRNVVWFAARHESVIDYHFFVSPLSTGLFDVR